MTHRVRITPLAPHLYEAEVDTGRIVTRHRVTLTREFLAGCGPADEELVAHQAVSALARRTPAGRLPAVLRLTVPYPKAPGLIDESATGIALRAGRRR